MGILDKGAEIVGAVAAVEARNEVDRHGTHGTHGTHDRPVSLTMRTLRLPLAAHACAMAIAAASVAMLGACTVTPWHSTASQGDDASAAASEAAAPSSTPTETPIETPAPAIVAEVPPSSAAADFYCVKAGDTLSRIAAAHKQRAADIAAWNKLPASGMVKVGQLLRVAPPTKASATAPATATPAATPATLPAKSLAAPASPPAPATASSSAALASTAPSAPTTPSRPVASAPGSSTSSASSASSAPAQPAAAAHANARLAWPVSGSVVTPFAPGKLRGIVIACAAGAPVKAAAAGRVMYAGSGMKGYGKLVIVKHNAHLITAYGRNGRLLVKQGDTVKLGQQIATSGADAAGVGALLFEVRENGRPVDPVAQLPRKQP
ncbi:peptidoglycan DD-metalloendopeptidase family protein [Paraburkholderia tagetis]|uniref:Peptidoglycan DD-metalloendopeptidase family protein n=1 Tax=Paraburkholderia tagetis TaxID=2913261 RepID=A0A9X1UIN7_9BURK|nr:peptidoglycan DD-metalloendopeptidase family protein [Paraburkholderia tagetis]MCG5075548.1 peptidoglycan DD-metalloendopeptidase family protein [Paraburkholderia tagetis]